MRLTVLGLFSILFCFVEFMLIFFLYFFFLAAYDRIGLTELFFAIEYAEVLPLQVEIIVVFCEWRGLDGEWRGWGWKHNHKI